MKSHSLEKVSLFFEMDFSNASKRWARVAAVRGDDLLGRHAGSTLEGVDVLRVAAEQHSSLLEHL